MNYYLGIDTSNYTTSLAAIPQNEGEGVCVRTLLQAPVNSVGLRQSDAHFLHTKHLPELSCRLREALPRNARCVGVGVSVKPRPEEGSYMPCFLAGVSAAHAAALAAGVPLYETTHQEGHLKSALYGAPDFPCVERFFAIHLSGGTLECLEVCKRVGAFGVRVASKTLDLTLGQLIDRVGVAMGFPFPCGKALDELAFSHRRSFSVKIPEKSEGINLSGFENRAKELILSAQKEDVAAYLFCVAEQSIRALCRIANTGDTPVLICGGVGASKTLRRALAGERYYFTAPEWATDNALGVALIAKEKGTV